MAKKIIGTIPVARGEYSASANYYKENIVTMYGMTFRCVKNTIGKAPATLTSGKATLTNTDVWQLACGSKDIYNVTTQVQMNANGIADETSRAKAAEAEAVQKGKQLALRALFVAAGALYNDTSQVITRTDPLGGSVQHLPNCYYLGGLGDITEEQMAAIYAVGKIYTYNNTGRFRAYARTTLPSTITGGEGRGQLNFYYICAYNKSIEAFDVLDERYISNTLAVEDLNTAFSSCENLKYIYNILNVASIDSVSKIAGFGCPRLIEVRLRNLKVGVKFDKCPDISQQSVLYAIQNASPTSAITITLHPDAYARLENDAEIVTALNEQPLITLVSA